MDIEWAMGREGTEGTAIEELMGDEVDVTNVDFFNIPADNAPQTPNSSIFTSDIPNPLSSETDLCVTNSDSSPEDVENIKPVGPMLKRKAPTVGKSMRSPPQVPTKRQRVYEGSSDEDSGREHGGSSRSAAATRKLRELVKSGKFVVDEQKKVTYERKCVGMDAKARFRYEKKWEVLHSKCGKWFAMSEPYNTTKFKLHVEGCRSKGQNGLIDDFFKRRDGTETGVTMKIAKPGGRKHIIVGGHRSKVSSPFGKNPSFAPPPMLKPKLQGCRGIGEEHNNRIPVYISRALTDGAGSRSESAITTMLFGDNVKYSQLDEKSRNDVLVMQVKLRSWTICRELRVVYSTKCCNFISPASGTSATCNECLALLKLETFKKALRMEPPPPETAKFTPRRQYNSIRDLGINYAKIKGLAGLLDDVSSLFHPHSSIFSLGEHLTGF